MCFGVATGCNSEKQSEGGEPIWSDFETSLTGYVYELFYFDLPTVTDANGKELNVSVEVKDSAGEKQDTLGGFFVIRDAEDYFLTYSVKSGGKTYSKSATVTGIARAQYSVSPRLYSVGEEISLNECVTVSPESQRSFRVRKDGQDVAVENGKFTPQSEGSYAVTVSVPKQDNYTFTLTVIDVSSNPYPNGKISDSRGLDSDISVSFTHTGTDERLSATATATASFDENEKFDEASDGSTKIEVYFPKTSKGGYATISMKPEFGLDYYKSLYNAGYNNVAVRMKVATTITTVHGSIIQLRPLKNNVNAISISLFSQDGMYSRTLSESYYALWDFNLTGHYNEWLEVVLPMDQFIANYNADGMGLFYMHMSRFNDTESSLNTSDAFYGTTTVWIDNVYAVKPMSDKGGIIVKEFELSDNINVFSEAGISLSLDMDDLFEQYGYYDDSISLENGAITLDKSGIYTFKVRARNRYNVGGLQAVVGIQEGLISDRPDISGFTYNITYSGSGEENGNVSVGYVTGDKFAATDNGAIRITATTQSDTKQMLVNMYFKSEFSKSYYEDLKEKGYNYVDFKYKVVHNDNAWNSGSAVIFTVATNTYEYECIASDGTVKRAKQSTQGLWTHPDWGAGTYGWFVQRINIDTFLYNYNSSMLICLRSAASDVGTLDFYIGGIYAVKG